MTTKNKLSKIIISTAISLAASLSATTANAEQSYMTIGTGGQTGVYYVVGQSMCRLVSSHPET